MLKADYKYCAVCLKKTEDGQGIVGRINDWYCDQDCWNEMVYQCQVIKMIEEKNKEKS